MESLCKLPLYLHFIRGSTERQPSGLVNFVNALAYHLCQALPAAFMQPGDHLLAEPCMT